MTTTCSLGQNKCAVLPKQLLADSVGLGKTAQDHGFEMEHPMFGQVAR